MNKIVDLILSVLGLAALYEGWRRFRSGVPKPTQEKQVTRTDYLSGNYQDKLDKREKRLKSNKYQGTAYMGIGLGFLVAGIYLLLRLVNTTSQSENSR